MARRAGSAPACLRPDISFAVLPIRRHAFFEQTVLQGQIGDHLLERRGLTPKIVDLVRGGGPGCIASQALLSSLQEVLRPAIVQVLRDPLAATQLGNAVLAAIHTVCPMSADGGQIVHCAISCQLYTDKCMRTLPRRGRACQTSSPPERSAARP